ncbi:MAG: hypothetical protein IJX16_03590 [Clostridia bacterium]|nr:hypothetical protein [Clostridia bacterium]
MKKFLALIICAIMTMVCLFTVSCKAEPGTVSIKYYADGSKIVSAILSGKENIGVVPEPAASNLIKKASTQGKTLYKLDMQELYDSQSRAYPQAVLMIKESVLNTYPQLATVLKEKFAENVDYVKNNTVEAVNAIFEKLDVTTLQANALSTTAIDGCKIYWQDAVQAKEDVKNYIEDIISIDSSSAKEVTEDFFYDGFVSGSTDKEQLSFYAPDGAPSLAIAKFIKDQQNFIEGLTVDYNLVATQSVSTSLVPAYRGGVADIIILPVNMASKFYNEGENTNDNYKLVSVITHGNFYIISTEEISVSDLKDNRVAVPQKNAVPDWTFRSMLTKHNLKSSEIY